jgi:hypothetical protein
MVLWCTKLSCFCQLTDLHAVEDCILVLWRRSGGLLLCIFIKWIVICILDKTFLRDTHKNVFPTATIFHVNNWQWCLMPAVVQHREWACHHLLTHEWWTVGKPVEASQRVIWCCFKVSISGVSNDKFYPESLILWLSLKFHVIGNLLSSLIMSNTVQHSKC